MRGLSTVTSLVVCALALAAVGRAAADDCPDERASEVPARVEWGGEVERCGLGISIFGLPIQAFGPRCPDTKFFYPAHQECRGEKSTGSYCAFVGNIDVKRMRCECAELALLGTGVTIPDCSCKDDGTAGHVEDAQTYSCSAVGVSS